MFRFTTRAPRPGRAERDPRSPARWRHRRRARLVASVSALVLAAIVGLGLAVVGTADERPEVVVVPLVNGTVSGWLVDYATERNYMVNTYLAHLDADPRYAVYSGPRKLDRRIR